MAIPVRQSRPTVYNGITMRSRLEARVAAWLSRNGFTWEYEPAAFKMDRGGEYLPDFAIGPLPQGLGWGGALVGAQQVPGFLEVKPGGVSLRFWQLGLGPGWESDDPELFGPTWDSGWFGSCTDCERVGLFFSPGHWSCQWCGHHAGNSTWTDPTDWPYLPEAWRVETESRDA